MHLSLYKNTADKTRDNKSKIMRTQSIILLGSFVSILLIASHSPAMQMEIIGNV